MSDDPERRRRRRARTQIAELELAELEGRHAACSGEPVESCPYRPGLAQGQRRAWTTGWSLASHSVREFAAEPSAQVDNLPLKAGDIVEATRDGGWVPATIKEYTETIGQPAYTVVFLDGPVCYRAAHLVRRTASSGGPLTHDDLRFIAQGLAKLAQSNRHGHAEPCPLPCSFCVDADRWKRLSVELLGGTQLHQRVADDVRIETLQRAMRDVIGGWDANEKKEAPGPGWDAAGRRLRDLAFARPSDIDGTTVSSARNDL